MAVVNFYRTVPKSDGGFAPADGYLRFRQTAPRVITGTPDNTVLDSAFTMWLVNGLASPDLAQTTSAWAWEVEEHVTGKDVVTYVIQVPSGAGPFDEPDLTRLDPASLTPAPQYSTVNERLTALESGGGGGTAPDATTTSKGIVKLAGELGGTADLPTVPGLAGKANTSHTHNASDVNGGVLAVARLGSGTPAAGKYVDGGTGAWTTLPAGGGGASSFAGAPQSGGYMVYPSGDVSTLSLFGFTYFVPMYLTESLTLQEVAVEVTTAAASSVLKIGYYTMDSTGTLNLGAAFSTTLDASTTGIKAATGSWTLPAGVVWLGIGWSGAGCTVRAASRVDLPGPIFTPNATVGMQSAANLIRGGGQIGDATITPTTDGSVAPPKFRLRKA